jgi:hypothetical protein
MAEILLTRNEDDGSQPNGIISDSALTVAQSAFRFQTEASTDRLTTKTGIPELETNFKNLTKANAIKEERRAKRDFELKHKDLGIKVAGSLWSLDENGKMTQV